MEMNGIQPNSLTDDDWNALHDQCRGIGSGSIRVSSGKLPECPHQTALAMRLAHNGRALAMMMMPFFLLLLPAAFGHPPLVPGGDAGHHTRDGCAPLISRTDGDCRLSVSLGKSLRERSANVTNVWPLVVKDEWVA